MTFSFLLFVSRLNNTLNPNWVSVFTIDYELGTPLKLMVQVYDQVNAETNKPMAAASFDIAECLGARGNTTAKEMKNGGTYVQHDLQLKLKLNTNR